MERGSGRCDEGHGAGGIWITTTYDHRLQVKNDALSNLFTQRKNQKSDQSSFSATWCLLATLHA